MADKDFVVKNGLVVDTSTLVVDATNNRVGINNTSPDASLTVTGTANVSGDVTLSATLYLNAVSANGTLGSSGQALTTNGSAVYWANVSGSGTGGGYYKGSNGTVGDAGNINNLYRLNANTQSANITISSGENALTVGPMTIDTGYNLTISEGGRAVII